MKSEHCFNNFVVWSILCLIPMPGTVTALDKKHVLRVSQNTSIGFFEYLNQTGLHCGENQFSSSSSSSPLYRHDWIDSFKVTDCMQNVELIFGYYNFSYKYNMNTTMQQKIDEIFTTIPGYVTSPSYNDIINKLHYLQNVGRYELLTLNAANNTIYSGIYTDTTASTWPIFVYSEDMQGSPYHADNDQKTLAGMKKAQYVDIVVYFKAPCPSGNPPYFRSNVNKTDRCPRPPKITVTHEKYPITYNQTMMLACHVEAIPPANKTYWIKNGAEIKLHNSPHHNSSLIILRADHTHLGIYQCCATNSYKNVCGRQIMITGDPYVYIDQTMFEYEPGKNLSLHCEFISYPPASEIYWNQTRVDNSANRHTLLTASNTSGDYAWNIDVLLLDIVNMTSEDRGTYRCCVINNIGTICDGPVIIGEKLNVTVPTTEINATRNQSTTLRCTTEGFPEATYLYWYTPHGIYSPSSSMDMSIDHDALTIHHPMFSDSGAYICTANNDFGESNSTEVTLIVNGVMVTSPNKKYQAIFSQNITLECIIEYHPELGGVEWRRTSNSSEQVNISTDGIKYSGSSVAYHSLVINNLNFNDGGWYICTGHNEYQNDESNPILLNVTGGLPAHVRINTTSVMVNTSDDMALLCEYDAVPKVINITWYKDAHGVVTKMKRVHPLKVLKFTKIQLSDAGNYTCCATNAVGSKNSSAVSIQVNEVEPMCPCACEFKERLEYWAKNPPPNHTMAEWRKILENVTEGIKRNLTIDKKTTTASIRKRISAPDDRKSAKSVGIVGTILICIFFGSFVLFDIFAWRHYLTQIRGMGRRRR